MLIILDEGNLFHELNLEFHFYDINFHLELFPMKQLKSSNFSV